MASDVNRCGPATVTLKRLPDGLVIVLDPAQGGAVSGEMDRANAERLAWAILAMVR